MTKEELTLRIEKKNEQIAKIEKKIAKWIKNSESEEAFLKECSWRYNFEERKEEYRSDWARECEREIGYARRDLEEAKATVAKYEEQITKIVNFEKEEKIEVIWSFLQDWKVKANNWYHLNAILYFDLYSKEDEEWEAVKEKYAYINSYGKTMYSKRSWWNEYYSSVHALTRDLVVSYSRRLIDEEKLEKILNKEVEAKYKDLVNRISSVVGEIVDASNLSIGNQHGEINGLVKGTKASAKVETISAGGYNIQCFHYRVLVKEVR